MSCVLLHLVDRAENYFAFAIASSIIFFIDAYGTAPETNVPFTNVAGVPLTPAVRPEAVSASTTAWYFAELTQSANFFVSSFRSEAVLLMNAVAVAASPERPAVWPAYIASENSQNFPCSSAHSLPSEAGTAFGWNDNGK